MTQNPGEKRLVLVYDGQCPLCRSYSGAVRIMGTVGKLTLVNAREENPWLEQITARGLDMDEGMVVILGQDFYHGADALHVLALLGSRAGLFNRLNYRIFRSRTLSQRLYPLLRSGRNLLLRLLRKGRINNLER